MLPKVENPIPETIGLGTIFSAAGAGGVLMLIVATTLGLPDQERDALVRNGIVVGFVGASCLYLLALLNQLL
jgi:hypothetical protein